MADGWVADLLYGTTEEKIEAFGTRWVYNISPHFLKYLGRPLFLRVMPEKETDCEQNDESM